MTGQATAADVLATLHYHQVLEGVTLKRAMDLCGIDRDQLKQGIDRRRAARWEPLCWNDPQPETQPEPDRRRKPARRDASPRPDLRKPGRERDQRPAPDGDGVELWCTGSDNDPGHWAPEIDFAVRADRPHLRVSKCDEHRKAYQRARRVSMRAEQAIGEAGLKLTVDADSNLLGIECKTCGQPFAAGDEVHGTAVLEHAACHRGDR